MVQKEPRKSWLRGGESRGTRHEKGTRAQEDDPALRGGIHIQEKVLKEEKEGKRKPPEKGALMFTQKASRQISHRETRGIISLMGRKGEEKTGIPGVEANFSLPRERSIEPSINPRRGKFLILCWERSLLLYYERSSSTGEKGGKIVTWPLKKNDGYKKSLQGGELEVTILERGGSACSYKGGLMTGESEP